MFNRFLLICCVCLSRINCFVTKYSEANQDENKPRQPLILTPLINEGKVEEARSAAEVKLSDFQNIKSYAAYLTVSETFNSNLFFWFIPSQNDYENAPVMLWLNGGPGGSSLYYLFGISGPFEFNPEQNCELKFREHSLSTNHSLLYIDNPVGTGFSFTDEDGYAKNQTIIGEQLYEALLQFFQLFPELQKNDFIIAGISYAGKYIPAISYTIHKNNPTAKQKINLQGLAIGNGLSDPEHQLDYGEFLYQIGLIDFNTKIEMERLTDQAVGFIHQESWLNAWTTINKTWELYLTAAGFKNMHNYLIPDNINGAAVNNCVTRYFNSPEVKSAIHVGTKNFVRLSKVVWNHLEEDIPKSVTPWISTLLSHYRTLIYSGNLDVIVAYPLTVKFLQNLKFSGADEYKSAIRNKWYVEEDLAGYVKTAGNLTEVMVRNAGHSVLSDQPHWAFDMISKFVRNESLF